MSGETTSEMFCRVSDESRFTATHALFMSLSGVLAAVALVTNSVPILIGAMIVAPAFPALAMVPIAIARRRYRRAAIACVTLLAGIGLAVASAGLCIWILSQSGVLNLQETLQDQPLFEERVRVGWYSFLVAAAAGVAATIAKIRNKVDALIGTLASFALVPAGAAGAIAFLAGDLVRAWGGFCLLAINLLVIASMGIFVTLAMEIDRRPSFLPVADPPKSLADADVLGGGEWRS